MDVNVRVVSPDPYVSFRKSWHEQCLLVNHRTGSKKALQGERAVVFHQALEGLPAPHSAQCGQKGYPVGPVIMREIKSLPHHLFDSGRKEKKKKKKGSQLPLGVNSVQHPLINANCSTKETISLTPVLCLVRICNRALKCSI